MFKEVLGISLIVYAFDCYHVWSVYSDDIKFLAEVAPSQGEINDLKKRYTSAKENHVDQATYEKQIEKFKQIRKAAVSKLKETGCEKEFLLARESIPFFFGARAAFLQLAHPYIASGIIQHSNVKKNIHRRFLNTFKYVFSMSFEEDDLALKSSRTVRKLHDRITGELHEDIGRFKAGHKYSASNLNALYWVYQTLGDGSLLAFEMFVRKLTKDEKEMIFKHTFTLAAGFGIPQEYFSDSFEKSRRQFGVFLNSDYLAVGSDALDLKNYLLFIKNDASKKKTSPILQMIISWLTLMTLPKKIALQYFGRIPTRLETIVYILFCGWIRFTYRLLPSSFRFLNAYLDMKKRIGMEESLFHRGMRFCSGILASTAVRKLLNSSI